MIFANMALEGFLANRSGYDHMLKTVAVTDMLLFWRWYELEALHVFVEQPVLFFKEESGGEPQVSRELTWLDVELVLVPCYSLEFGRERVGPGIWARPLCERRYSWMLTRWGKEINDCRRANPQGLRRRER